MNLILLNIYKIMNLKRVSQLNDQFGEAKKKIEPLTDVWKSMNLDQYLRKDIIEKKMATRAFMQENLSKINEHVVSSEFPFWIIPKIQSLKINGC